MKTMMLCERRRAVGVLEMSRMLRLEASAVDVEAGGRHAADCEESCVVELMVLKTRTLLERRP